MLLEFFTFGSSSDITLSKQKGALEGARRHWYSEKALTYALKSKENATQIMCTSCTSRLTKQKSSVVSASADAVLNSVYQGLFSAMPCLSFLIFLYFFLLDLNLLPFYLKVKINIQ